MIEAAKEAGITLTMLLAVYEWCFDRRPLASRQRRFGYTIESYLRLRETLEHYEGDDERIGAALHSMPVVLPTALRQMLETPQARRGPIHIHIAEQIGEVQDSLAVRGARPGERLFDNAQVDENGRLVHTTHLTAAETTQLACSGAVAGLCPTTEANLGDGLFPLASYLDAGGTVGIGSDSHISISPVEPLRSLEYGRRLQSHHRNAAALTQGASVGEILWRAALKGSAQDSGLPVGEWRAGARADLIVLDATSPLLAARNRQSMLDNFVLSGNTPRVRDVMCGGRWQVRQFQHRDESRIAERYRQVVERWRQAD